MSVNTQVSGILSKVFANTLVGGLTLSKSATYTKQTQGTYNALTGAITNTTANVTVNVIETEFTSYEVGDSGGSILATDKKVLMSPLSGVSIEQASNDRLNMDSRDFQIMNVVNREMGGTDLVWEVQCR